MNEEAQLISIQSTAQYSKRTEAIDFEERKQQWRCPSMLFSSLKKLNPAAYFVI